MKLYNPDISPDPQAWLALSEATLLSLIMDFIENSDENMDEKRNKEHCAGPVFARG